MYGMVLGAYNSTTQEALGKETVSSGQPGFHSKTLSQANK